MDRIKDPHTSVLQQGCGNRVIAIDPSPSGVAPGRAVA
jgi:hypothetical protein